MRILVTGVTGQLGSALLPRMAAFGTIIPADRALIDMSAPRDIAARLTELAPHVIINPAAYTAVDNAEEHRDLAFLVNEAAPLAIACWAAPRHIPLIHFSTDYVFDGSGTIPWKETDSPSPLSVYGASKLAGEIAIQKVGGPHLVIRTSWVYGPRGRNFYRTILRLAEELEELRIVADQFGAPTSTETIADALASMFATPQGISETVARNSGLVHLTASGTTTWHEFACAIVDCLRIREAPAKVARIVPIATSECARKAKRPLNCRLDLSKLAGVFGIVTPHWRKALDAVAVKTINCS